MLNTSCIILRKILLICNVTSCPYIYGQLVTLQICRYICIFLWHWRASPRRIRKDIDEKILRVVNVWCSLSYQSMYLIPYTTNKSKLSLIYRFLCLRFVQFATHTYYLAILHSIIFWEKKSVLVQLFLFYLQQQVYRWAKRISFPLDENLLHGVLFTSCTQSISSAGLDCTPPTPHNSHTLHFWRGQNLKKKI